MMHEYLDGAFSRALNELLIARHRQGIKVRVILCQGGCWQWPGTKESALVEELRSAGIEVLVQPLWDGQEHRKLLIVDGEVALFGGATISDQTFSSREFIDAFGGTDAERDADHFPKVPADDVPRMHDLMVRFSGSSVAFAQAMFLQQWAYRGGAIDPTAGEAATRARYFPGLERDAPSPGGSVQVTQINNVPGKPNQAHAKLLELIQGAQTSLDLEFPYLLLPDLIDALCARASAGVRVRLLLPGYELRLVETMTNSGMRSWYPELLARHGEIREYTGSGGAEQGYNHGKIAVADIDSARPRMWISTGNPERVLSASVREKQVARAYPPRPRRVSWLESRES